MNSQLICNSLGEPIGIFIPMDDWNKLKELYTGLDQYQPGSVRKQPIDDYEADAQPKKAYSVEQIRQTCPAAYAPWTNEDERKLKLMYFDEKPIAEIAEVLGRKKGAILSRLSKLGINVIR